MRERELAKLQGFCKMEVEYLCNLKAYLGLHFAKNVKIGPRRMWEKEKRKDGIGLERQQKNKNKIKKEGGPRKGRQKESPTWAKVKGDA